MKPFMIEVLKTNQENFSEKFKQRMAVQVAVLDNVEHTVKKIIEDVRVNGDVAILNYTNRFDQFAVNSVGSLEVSHARLDEAMQLIDKNLCEALQEAALRIREFHEKQNLADWRFTDSHGNLLGQKITPLDRVGVYVPGGKAAYPSSVLMNVIPAKIAGVQEVIMVVPAPKGQVNDVVLAAAKIAEVDRVFMVGGAQAVAALAYGTATIPRVDKIVGPGNAYVASAKKLVFGDVGIDMIAGPSEILVICDGKTNPEWIAYDLFSQAEHDESAQAILLAPDENFINEVLQAMQNILPTLTRQDIIRKSITERGLFIRTRDISEAIDLANQIAPEHLELSIENPLDYVEKIKHAGAIFLGRYTPEAIGDYCAGPNHVLPTSGSARFFSGLGVYDFQKRSSLIFCSAQGVKPLAKIAATLAESEGLTAHLESAKARMHTPQNR